MIWTMTTPGPDHLRTAVRGHLHDTVTNEAERAQTLLGVIREFYDFAMRQQGESPLFATSDTRTAYAERIAASRSTGLDSTTCPPNL